MAQLLTRIEPQQIEQLGPDDLVRLLHRLLHCEARKLWLARAGILVPFQITVPDGGSDGTWNADIGPHDYIPRTLTYYQCKAERVTEGLCRGELASKNKDGTLVVKPRVAEVLSQGGCYAFFSTGHEIKTGDDDDVDKIARDELSKAGFTPAVGAVIELIGSNRIADWANRFPAAIRFVLEVTKGFTDPHYYTVEEWGNLANMTGDFYRNDAIDRKISQIRTALTDSTTRLIRLTGLSGVGKTRLVYEALQAGPSSSTEVLALQASSIYISFEDLGNDLFNFIHHLARNSYSAAIVIDDCPSWAHDKIANIVANSELSVLTIFHEPQESRNDTEQLVLEPAEMGDVVERILREDTDLVVRGDDAVRAITDFAEGFPQIAKLITEFHRAPTTDELRDRARLFQKLLSGGQDPERNTLRAIQSLALFRALGGSASELDRGLEVVRKLFCPNIDKIDFLAIIKDQTRRRIVQKIADTIVVVPRPLSVALAADFIQVFPVGEWPQVLDTLQEHHLISLLIDRLEELELSEKRDEIGRLFAERGLPFDNAEYLFTGTTGSQMFRVIALLSPPAAIKIARSAIGGASLQTLEAAKAVRRDLVRSLELLVWDDETFPDAAALLLRLAAAENESWANNATGVLHQLYHLYLSGTKVSAAERLKVLAQGIRSPEEAVRRVSISAYGAGLAYGHYSRGGNTTLGGIRDAKLDWQPRTKREGLDYWRECYCALQRVILEDGPDAQYGKQVLAKNITVVLQTPLLVELEHEFKQLSEHMRGLWPEVKDQIKRILARDESLTLEHRQGLERWKGFLTPSDESLEDQLQDIVVTPGWHHRKGLDGHYVDVSREEAERLAASLATTATDLVPYLPQLMSGEQQQGYAFGVIIANQHPHAEEIIQSALDCWITLDRSRRNLALLSGLIHGLSRDRKLRESVLHRIVEDTRLIELLVPLSAAGGELDVADFLRIRRAVMESRLDPQWLYHLKFGQPLSNLPDEFLREQFSEILEIKPEATKVIFEVLWQHCSDDRGKFKLYTELFQRMAVYPGLPILMDDFGWVWAEITKRLADDSEDRQWLESVARSIRDAIVRERSWVRTDHLSGVMRTLFRQAPLETFGVFGESLRSGDPLAQYIIAEFVGGADLATESPVSALWAVPEAEFREWVKLNRDLAPLLLRQIALYETERFGDDTERFRWHPHALILLREIDDTEVAVEALLGNLLSFSSVGSRVPYLEKRLELVTHLLSLEESHLSQIAEVAKRVLQEEINKTRRHELNEQILLR
jgi:hypothetical protein